MTTGAISPLRRRMIEDMNVRGFMPKTQQHYIRAVREFTAFFGRSPDQAEAEDIRRYQVHLRDRGTSTSSMNAAVSGLRFFFTVTLDRPGTVARTITVREPRKLPVVLSPGEVAAMLQAAPGLKYRAALSVAYAAGLRAAEVVALKPSDIDSTRMVIRVEQGKGRKDRYVMLAGFHRIRHYGFLANARRVVNVAQARALIAEPQPPADTDTDPTISEPPRASPPPCPHCGGIMAVVETFLPGTQPRAPPSGPAAVAIAS